MTTTASAISYGLPIAAEAIGFAASFVYTYHGEIATPSLSPHQKQLLEKYSTNHEDRDISAAVHIAQKQKQRRQQELARLRHQRSALDDQTETFIARIILERDQIMAAALRHGSPPPQEQISRYQCRRYQSASPTPSGK